MRTLSVVWIIVCMVAWASCSTTGASQKHGRYEIAVASVERAAEWKDPVSRDMVYKAGVNEIVLVVTIKITTPTGGIDLAESEVRDAAGGTYKSKRTSYKSLLGNEVAGTDDVPLPFIVPADADITRLTLEGQTTFDISELAAGAKR